MPQSPCAAPLTAQRLICIDALRGLVMLFMLLDHVRETFLLHRQVSDPMDVTSVEPALFFSRTLAHLCAPVFILLTGLSAFLYGRNKGGRRASAQFLLTRGLFLIALELTLVNFAWTLQWPPQVIYLQVIWAIGISMVALSLLLWLPRPWLVAVGVLIVAGHNLLDGVHFAADSPWHGLWAVLHDRGWLELGGLRLRTSYPVLPWFGVIMLGYAMGPWFADDAPAGARLQRLALCTAGCAGLFIALRWLNGYGDAPWQPAPDALHNLMALLNITKYPPSLVFVCLTLSCGLGLLMAFERWQERRWVRQLALLGGAPMFFYLLHLYVLKLLYIAAVASWGLNQGAYFGFDGVGQLWLASTLLAVALYPAAAWFAGLKRRRRDLTWLRYL